MGRDILSEYGKDSGAGQKPRAESGGVTETKDLPYKSPVGPTQQMRRQVGLGGTNHGCCGSQGKH